MQFRPEILGRRGNVIAHQHFPISDFLAIAEELLRSAKNLKDQNSVDFEVISSSMAEDPVDKREKESRKSSNYRTMKPYELANLMKRIEGIEDLKKTAPASKVKALYRIAYEDNQQAELEYLDVLTRLDEESAAKLRRLIGTDFWTTAASGQRGTSAADIVELWDFCE